ncbi:MAG TPA: hypothetical protein VFV34_19635 [Blastocatellia bacterium]|nr:hypothetical protein [Blastocatellia bacterium]
MKSIVRTLLSFVALVACVVVTQAQDNVSGQWDVTIETPQQTITRLITLKAEGEKLTGAFKGPNAELPISGTVKGNDIKIVYTVSFQGNDLTITMTGTVEKASMKGTADFGGLASGPWSAVPHKEGQGTPAAAPAASAPAASSGSVNITGNWDVTVQTDQGSGSPSFTFKQDGEKLTGTYKGMFGEAPVQGTVKGNDVTFLLKVNAQGTDLTLEYKGTIDKDTMKGTVKLGELGNGTWTAKRK